MNLKKHEQQIHFIAKYINNGCSGFPYSLILLSRKTSRTMIERDITSKAP